MGQEKPDKNAYNSTINIAVLPSLSETISLSYSESSTHPLSESSTSRSLSSSMKSLYPILHSTNISLNNHCIFTNLNVKTTQQKVIEFPPSIGRKFVFKPVSVWLCFQRPSFRRRRKHNSQEQGPCSRVRNVLNISAASEQVFLNFQSTTRYLCQLGVNQLNDKSDYCIFAVGF